MTWLSQLQDKRIEWMADQLSHEGIKCTGILAVRNEQTGGKTCRT
jgi:hypothetical protein